MAHSGDVMHVIDGGETAHQAAVFRENLLIKARNQTAKQTQFSTKLVGKAVEPLATEEPVFPSGVDIRDKNTELSSVNIGITLTARRITRQQIVSKHRC